jgi:hypothetical protein
LIETLIRNFLDLNINKKIHVMDTKNNSPSRRNFLKGVMINGAVLSAVPLGVPGSESTTMAPARKLNAPRLPLKIYFNTREGYFYRDPVSTEFRENMYPGLQMNCLC